MAEKQTDREESVTTSKLEEAALNLYISGF